MKDIKRLEESALSILSLEKKYTKIYEEYEMSKDTISDLTLITEKLKLQQLDEAKKIYSIIEEIESHKSLLYGFMFLPSFVSALN